MLDVVQTQKETVDTTSAPHFKNCPKLERGFWSLTAPPSTVYLNKQEDRKYMILGQQIEEKIHICH